MSKVTCIYILQVAKFVPFNVCIRGYNLTSTIIYAIIIDNIGRHIFTDPNEMTMYSFIPCCRVISSLGIILLLCQIKCIQSFGQYPIVFWY